MIRSTLELRAAPGRREELLRRLDLVETLASRRAEPGYLGTEIQLPFDDEDAVVVWTAWASKEHFERWLEGNDPALLLVDVKDLVAGRPRLRLFRVIDTIE
jgi:heme-degrading monooxygenase HmoA